MERFKLETFEIDLTDENLKDGILIDHVENNKKLHALAELVNNANSNTMICLDGAVGSGKTVFLFQFINLIKSDKTHKILKISDDLKRVYKDISENNYVSYYNAWANDEHSDVFASIFFNILNNFPNEKDKIAKFDTGIKKCIDEIISKTSNASINLKGQGANLLDNVKSYEELAENIVTFEKKKKSFKNFLEKFLRKDKRLILIIDELDRCNPWFATKLLEVVKHFYCFKNITVIFACDNQELVHVIKKQYGIEYDVYAYLNKFYDFVISLNDEKKEGYYLRNVLKFGQYLSGVIDSMNFSKKLDLEPAFTKLYAYDFIYFMLNKYNFSYREMNKFMTMYSMAVKDFKKIENNFCSGENLKIFSVTFFIILPILIVLMIKDYETYKACLNGNAKILEEKCSSFHHNFPKKWDYFTNKLQFDEKMISIIYTKILNGFDVEHNCDYTPIYNCIKMDFFSAGNFFKK